MKNKKTVKELKLKAENILKELAMEGEYSVGEMLLILELTKTCVYSLIAEKYLEKRSVE